MASNSANVVGPRQKRRRVQAELNNIVLAIASNSATRQSASTYREEVYAGSSAVNIGVDPSGGDSPDYTLADDTQSNKDFRETLKVTEFDYESDAVPVYSSCDECEVSSDDDSTPGEYDLLSGVTFDINGYAADDATPKQFTEKLASWAVNFRVKQNAIDNLLTEVLPAVPSYEELNLPKTCRTLLKTRKKTTLKMVEPGHYFHFGLVRGITFMLGRYGFHLKENMLKEFRFLVNTDGLPIAKASGSQVWPIQCRFFDSAMVNWPPFVLGIYHGNHKPKYANDYMKDFVNEVIQLQRTGFVHNGNLIKISVFGFTCDAPANAMIKCIKSHTAYESCPKCEVHGKWAGRVVLLETSAPARIHENFINKTQDGHHNGTSSILENLGIDMITSFAIDYMHCVCLGVVRKLLWLWIRGPLRTRIGRQNIDRISALLVGIANFIPCDFARKPRSLNELPRWKATELRQFLLYTGPAVLKEIFKGKPLQDFYDNFMLLHTGIKILSLPHLCQDPVLNNYAKELLIAFVQHCKIIYGEWFISYSVHCLIHLADDVIKFGHLDNFSTFPFENNMKKIKAMIRKNERPLIQIVRRIFEEETNVTSSCQTSTEKTVLKKKHTGGPILSTGGR